MAPEAVMNAHQWNPDSGVEAFGSEWVDQDCITLRYFVTVVRVHPWSSANTEIS